MAQPAQLRNAVRSPAETNPIVRFYKKPTAHKAIVAKCAECVGCTKDRTEPGFRHLIRDCASTTCPLHTMRPYTKTKD